MTDEESEIWLGRDALRPQIEEEIHPGSTRMAGPDHVALQ